MIKFLVIFFYLLRIFVKSDNQAHLNNSLYVNCKDKYCLIITSFKIPDNNSLNCVEDYLKIVFEYQFENKTNTQVEGYIIEGESNIIASKQRLSKYCRKIRRYYLDQNNLLIKYGESVYKIDRKYVSTFIEKMLYEEGHYIIQYLYKLDFYDEKTDNILIIKAFKEIIAIYFCIRLSYMLIIKLYIWYKCNSMMVENYKNKQASEWHEISQIKNKKNK